MSHSVGGEEHTRKRQRLSYPQQSITAKASVKWRDGTSNPEYWSSKNFFAVDTTPLNSFGGSTEDNQTGPFFAHDGADINSWNLRIIELSPDTHAHQTSVTDILFPTLPLKVNRQVDLGLLNPFAKHAKERQGKPRVPIIRTNTGEVNGEINGYIKIRIQSRAFEEIKRPQNLFHHSRTVQPASLEHKLLPREIIPLLPPDFGRGLGLDADDNKLFTFCK